MSAETLTSERGAAVDPRLAGVRRLAIVPAYNEAGSISAVIAEIRAADPGLDIVVIDDGSRDATSAIARREGVEVVRLPFNLGIGGAVQTGYKYALENGYRIAIQIDGDGQHDPRELPKLLAPLLDDQADMVVGTRWRDVREYRAPLTRRIGIVLFARLVSLIVGQRVTDTTSGFRAVNRHGIRLFAADYPHDYPEVETTVLVFRHRLRMQEVGVIMRERAAGESSITLVRSVYYVVKVSLALFVGLFRRPATLPEDA